MRNITTLIQLTQPTTVLEMPDAMKCFGNLLIGEVCERLKDIETPQITEEHLDAIQTVYAQITGEIQ